MGQLLSLKTCNFCRLLLLQSFWAKSSFEWFSGHLKFMHSSSVVGQLSCNCPAVVRQSSGSRQAVVRQSSGRRQAVVKQTSGSRQAVVWRSCCPSRDCLVFTVLKCPVSPTRFVFKIRKWRIEHKAVHFLSRQAQRNLWKYFIWSKEFVKHFSYYEANNVLIKKIVLKLIWIFSIKVDRLFVDKMLKAVWLKVH